MKETRPSSQIIDEIRNAFSLSILEIKDQFGETTLQIVPEEIKEVLAFIKEQGFDFLIDLTAVDYLIPEPRTEVIYWLLNPTNYTRIRLVVKVKREGSLPSICQLWEGANWYEREIYDLFGVRFSDHPDLTRLLMPDDWKGHPLRRDYPLTEVPVEFKHSAEPKIPSKVISDVTSKFIR